jgi:hypothetical protein
VKTPRDPKSPSPIDRADRIEEWNLKIHRTLDVINFIKYKFDFNKGGKRLKTITGMSYKFIILIYIYIIRAGIHNMSRCQILLVNPILN